MKHNELMLPIFWVLAALFVLGWMGCGDDDDDDDAVDPEDDDDSVDDDTADDDDDSLDDDDDDSVERWPQCDESATTQTVSFVHINDLHGNYSPQPFLPEYFLPQAGMDYDSPASRIVGFYKKVKSENPFTVFSSGGDDHEKGSVAEPLSDGYATSEVVKAMKFDVRVIGNHDFAWGEEEVLFFSNDDHAHVLSSNTRYTGESKSGFGAVAYAEYRIGCLSIGFFGMCPKPYDETNGSYEGPYMPNFETRFDYAVRAQEIVTAHRDEVDLLVMVSHLGVGEDKKIAEQTPGIDVILGGHSHTDLWKPEVVGDTIIIQAGSGGAYAARLDVTVDLSDMNIVDSKYRLHINAPGLFPVDDETQTAIESIMNDYAPDVLAPAAVLKNPQWEEGVGMLTTAAAMYATGADAAILDSDTMWAITPLPTWRAGGINPERFIGTFKMERQPAGTPSWTALYTVMVSGADLIRIRDEHGSDWFYAGPNSIDSQADYLLVANKRTAYHPNDYLLAGIAFSTPTFACETWDALNRYAEHRTQSGLYFDSDDTLPGN